MFRRIATTSFLFLALFSFALCASFAEEPEAGTRMVLVYNGVEFPFRYCPAGTFMMGSPEEEKDHTGIENLHQVTLTHSYWLLETEVTQKMWDAVLDENPSLYRGENRPAEGMTWFEAKNFIDTLSAKTGWKVSFPTEAQWEYACRAGATGRFGCGETTEDLIASGWFAGTRATPFEGTHEVAQKKPNAWGFYDMHGNVDEWCFDYTSMYPQEAVVDPTGNTEETACIFRGGRWYSKEQECRCASRNCCMPQATSGSVGVRICIVEP